MNGSAAKCRRLALTGQLLLYHIKGEALLYSLLSQRLFGLDRATTILLLRLSGGDPPESIAADPTLVAELTALLAGEEPPAGEYCPELFCQDNPLKQLTTSSCYRLLDTTFTLECDDPALQSTLESRFVHLAAAQPAHVDLALEIQREPDTGLLRLLMNGAVQGDVVPDNMLLPRLYDRLRKHAYQRYPYLLAIHASVVEYGNSTFIFPGESGSGKSTLSAALLARGGRLYSDEVALVTPEGALLPIPLAMGLKSGSWPLLTADFPVLATTPEQLRWDGLRLRYLEQGVIDYAEASGFTTHICFPQFATGSASGLEPLTPVQALRSLTLAGYQVKGLTEDGVEQIIAWLSGLSCFAMSYGSTEEALQLLEQLEAAYVG